MAPLLPALEGWCHIFCEVVGVVVCRIEDASIVVGGAASRSLVGERVLNLDTYNTSYIGCSYPINRIMMLGVCHGQQ